MLVVFGKSTCEIVDIDRDARHMTVTDPGADVGSTDIKEVWTQSSDSVLADVRDRLIHGCAEQESANHLVTVDNETRN